MTKKVGDIARFVAELRMLWHGFQGAWAVDGGMESRWYEQTANYLYRTKEFRNVPVIQLWDWVEPQFARGVL